MPGPKPTRLTQAERQRLRAAQERIDRAQGDIVEARREWAAVVRELGSFAAVARELNVTPQAISDRVRAAEEGDR